MKSVIENGTINIDNLRSNLTEATSKACGKFKSRTQTRHGVTLTDLRNCKGQPIEIHFKYSGNTPPERLDYADIEKKLQPLLTTIPSKPGKHNPKLIELIESAVEAQLWTKHRPGKQPPDILVWTAIELIADY